MDDGGDNDPMRGLQLFLSNFAPMKGATGKPWAPRARNTTITIHNACSQPTRAMIKRIDDSTTNPKAAWVAMGSPPYPNADQLARLHVASQMPQESVALRPARGEEACTVILGPLELPAYSVVHVSGFA